MIAIFAEGISDPAAWGVAAQSLGPDRGVVLVVVVGAALALLFWRGAEKLGIVGAGQEFRLMRQALEKNAREQSLLRADFHIVVQWMAKREQDDPPELPPLSQTGDDGASISPPPLQPPPGDAPTSLRAPRAPTHSRP